MNTRKNIRLQNYNYSNNGVYFVTICTHKKIKLFCKIRRGDPCGRPMIEYTQLGKIAVFEIEKITNNQYGINVDKYVVMPNHIHILLSIGNNRTDSRKGCPYDVPQIIGSYKSRVSNEWLKICKHNNVTMGKIWQRSYYDHIIRDKKDYQAKWQYIENNPFKWELDKYFTE